MKLKKILAIVLFLTILALTLAACGSSGSNASDAPGTAPSAAPAESGDAPNENGNTPAAEPVTVTLGLVGAMYEDLWVPAQESLKAEGINLNAAVDHFKITVHGKAAHVSTPQKGVDALYIASQTVVSLQALVTRRISPVEPVIIGVGKINAGTTYNALAERAELEGTTRTTSLGMREQVRSWVTETAQRTAELYGGSADIVWTDFTAPLFNDSAACQEAAKVVEYLDTPVTLNRALSLSGDDFAEFLLKTPGVYAYLGTGNIEKPQTLNSNHNGNFDIDEETLTLGAGLYAGYALLTLNGELTQCQNHIHDQYH